MSPNETIDPTAQDALGSDGIAVALAQATRLTDADLRVPPPAVDAPAPWRTTGARVALPGGPAEPAPLTPDGLDTLLAARSSVRFFSDRPVDADGLTTVLRRVLDEDADAFPGEAGGGSAIELLVAPLRVDGLQPALYAVAGDGPATDRSVAAADGPGERRAAGTTDPARAAGLDRVADLPVGLHEDLVLQREFAGAAALVFVMGSIRAAEDRHGAHGHRLGLVRAGCAAHAGWLHAMRTGLAGTVFAGALPTALRSLAGVDGAERTQLFALAIGHAAVVPGR